MAAIDKKVSPEEKAARDAEVQAKYWIDELQTARNREKGYLKKGRDILSMYEGEKVKTTPFNILYSNTDTLSPALYNVTPRPLVKRRYGDDDLVAKEASEILRRSLEYLIDSVNQGETGFDDAMIDAVTQALLPGRGVTRFEYDAEVKKDEQGNPVEVGYEDVEIVQVEWDGFAHGYAKQWRNVPWVGFRLPPMNKAEVKENFGEKFVEELPFSKPASISEDGEKPHNDNDDRNFPEHLKVVEVWQIWDKTSRKVIHICPSYNLSVLKSEDPRTNFKGFFPCPRPLRYFRSVAKIEPQALYSLYESQAEELNTMTRRIKALIQAFKIRGFYDSTISDLEKVLSSEDNTLVPISNAAQMYGQGGGLDKAVWFYPVEKLTNVIQTLYQQREAAKQVLYEITGIADIMRGASAASETLGAQKLKSEWGTMRLKRMQRETSRYARDCMRLMAEVVAENFTAPGVQKMTNTKLMTQGEKQRAQQLAQAAGPQAAQQIPPDMAAALEKPSLEEVQALLKNEVDRCYRIDVETNSTVDVEATEDREQVGEALNAIAQFLNGIGPLVEKGMMDAELAKGMLLTVSKKFRFGVELEDSIRKMGTGPQPAQAPAEGESAQSGPSPEALAAQSQADQAKAQTQMMLEQQKQRTIEMQNELLEKEHALKMQELEAKSLQMRDQAAFGQAAHVQRMQQTAVAGQPGQGTNPAARPAKGRSAPRQ